jgi:hypothetical protein
VRPQLLSLVAFALLLCSLTAARRGSPRAHPVLPAPVCGVGEPSRRVAGSGGRDLRGCGRSSPAVTLTSDPRRQAMWCVAPRAVASQGGGRLLADPLWKRASVTFLRDTVGFERSARTS